MSDGYDPAGASHRALREIGRELRRHPAVQSARGHPPAEFTGVRADLQPEQFGRSVASGTLTVRWFAGEIRENRPEFSFHYSDPSGLDCGWHHEPNPHVDGWSHFQRREGTGEYRDEAISFGTLEPAPLVWSVLDRLEDRLDQ